MDRTPKTDLISRRTFLRRMAGGALAAAGGSVLAGCGGGGSSVIHDGRTGRDLYVSTFTGNTLENFDSRTGIHKRSISTGNGAAGMALGPLGDLFVALRFDDEVRRYDLVTGKPIPYNSIVGKTLSPHTVAIDPNGIAYVPNIASYFGLPGSQDSIEMFDARTSQHIGTFAHTVTPFSLTWGPDNDLYVSTALELSQAHPNSDQISQFGNNGGLLNTVVPAHTNAKVPFDILFTPDGKGVLVSMFLNNEVQLYDRTTVPWTLVQTLVTVPSPIGLAYGPNDGYLYVGSFQNNLGAPNSGSVQRFDPQTGTFIDKFVDKLSFAAFLIFV